MNKYLQIGTSMRCSLFVVQLIFSSSLGGDEMWVFDEVIIINDTEFYKKGERAHIVKVVDENNAIIYKYRMFHGRVEEIVNKNDFDVIKRPKISHDFSYYFDYYLKIKVWLWYSMLTYNSFLLINCAIYKKIKDDMKLCWIL